MPAEPRSTGAAQRAAIAAIAAIVSAAPAPVAAELAPTTPTSIGLFYRPGAPRVSSLWSEGDRGERLRLDGRVLTTRGRPVAGATVELWHADALGSVDETRYRATLVTERDGRFGIRTVLPGHIPMAYGNAVFGPRHIHIVVTHPAHPRLVSLIYFKGDPPVADSPYPELAIALEEVRVGDGEATVLLGAVEIVLE